MRLHFGVVDIPYVDAPTNNPRKRARSEAQTTGDVAEILEAEYGIMQHFLDLHGNDIGGALEDGLAGALETLLMGGSPAQDLFSTGESKIAETFRRFLESKEMDALGIPGVPTKASLMGVSQRFKTRRGPVRPSFIDSGQFEVNMKAWIER